MSFLPRRAADLRIGIHREELSHLGHPPPSPQIAYELDKEKKTVIPLLAPKLINHELPLSR